MIKYIIFDEEKCITLTSMPSTPEKMNGFAILDMSRLGAYRLNRRAGNLSDYPVSTLIEFRTIEDLERMQSALAKLHKSFPRRKG